MFTRLVQCTTEVKTFVLCCALLSFKVLAMAVIIGKTRLKKQIFISPEDTVRRGKVSYNDPDIERLRRAHLNDLENIPFFCIGGYTFLLTQPSARIAILFFVVYTISRFVHTYVYAIKVVPQPARRLSFQVGYIINLAMIIYSVTYVILCYFM